MRINKYCVLLFICLVSCGGGNSVKMNYFFDSSNLIVRENGKTKKVSLGKGNSHFYKINEHGDNVYIGFESGKIVKINKKDGKILWEKNVNTFVNVGFSFDDSNIYFVSLNNDFYVINQVTGEIKFIYYSSDKTTILNQVVPMTVDIGISVVFNDGKTILFDKNNWKVLKVIN